jgi:hypothetical protein
MRSSEGHCNHPLSLPLIPVSAPSRGWAKGKVWLL